MFDESKGPVDIFAEVDKTPKPGQPGGMEAPAAGRAVSTVSAGPSKLIFVGIAVLVLGLVGGGVWFFFLRGGETPPADDAALIDDTTPEDDTTVPTNGDTGTPEPSQPEPIVCGDAACEAPEDPFTCPQDCGEPPAVCGNAVCEVSEDPDSCPFDCAPPEPEQPILEPDPANQPADSDGDGLSDSQEQDLGTDPQSTDTDNDGLSDREEVQIYGSDPLKPDTDGDGFLDGEEVRNGYNPNGDGRLFEIPPSN